MCLLLPQLDVTVFVDTHVRPASFWTQTEEEFVGRWGKEWRRGETVVVVYNKLIKKFYPLHTELYISHVCNMML